MTVIHTQALSLQAPQTQQAMQAQIDDLRAQLAAFQFDRGGTAHVDDAADDDDDDAIDLG